MQRIIALLICTCLSAACLAQHKIVQLDNFVFTDRKADGYGWERVARIRHRALFSNSIACVADTVYSFGGFDTKHALREMNRLEGGRLVKDSLHYPGAGFFHNIFFATDSMLFIGGGKDSSESRYSFNDFWQYNRYTHAWKQLKDLPFYCLAPPRVLPGDTDVVVLVSRLEGEAFQVTHPVFYRYDIGSDTWQVLSIAPPVAGLLNPVACRNGDDLYVFFEHQRMFANYSRSFYDYNLQEGTWRELAPFPGRERSFTLLFCDNRYCYIGGGIGNKIVNYKDMYRYDPRKDLWEQIRDLPEGVRHAATWQFQGAHYIGFGLTDEQNEILIWKMK